MQKLVWFTYFTHIIFQEVGLASWRKKKPRPKTTPLGTTASACNVYGKKRRRKRKIPVSRFLAKYQTSHVTYQIKISSMSLWLADQATLQSRVQCVSYYYIHIIAHTSSAWSRTFWIYPDRHKLWIMGWISFWICILNLNTNRTNATNYELWVEFHFEVAFWI